MWFFLSGIVALKLLKTPWKIPFPSPLIVVSSGCDGTRDYWICIVLEAHVGIWNFHICFPVKLLELFFSSKTTFPLFLFHFFFSGGANFSGRGGRNPQSGSRGKKQPVGRGQSTINNPRGGDNQLSTRPAQRRTAQTVQTNRNEGRNITTSGPAWQQNNGNSSSFLTGMTPYNYWKVNNQQKKP